MTKHATATATLPSAHSASRIPANLFVVGSTDSESIASEPEGRARAVLGGAAHFDQVFGNELKCAHCDQPFVPRNGTGGKAQKFCKPECRHAWHAANPQRDQRSPTCDAPSLLPAIPERPSPQNEPAADSEPSSEFDWSRDRDDVVAHEQPASAVHWNPRGQLVIRQLHPLGDDDAYVYFSPQSLPALIGRLQTEYASWKRDSDHLPSNGAQGGEA